MDQLGWALLRKVEGLWAEQHIDTSTQHLHIHLHGQAGADREQQNQRRCRRRGSERAPTRGWSGVGLAWPAIQPGGASHGTASHNSYLGTAPVPPLLAGI